MIRAASLLALAFIGMATAWTGNGYYDRYAYGVSPMRADQDGYGFGSLFEANRRQFATSRMNTSGEYVRGYRGGGMDYYPSYDAGYGGYGGYRDMDYGYGGGRMLQRYRPNRNRYMGYGDYDYGYNGRYHWDNRDYTMGSYDYNYGGRYGRNNRYYNNNDYWSYSQSPRYYSGGYGPNYDSYRYY